MNMTRDRVRSIVWAIVIAVAMTLLMALTFRVNALKSEVRLTERRIVAIEQEKQALDTEFQTRANQQQLAAMNAVEFGLKAPDADQYVGGERQLAALSRPEAPAIAPPAAPNADVRLARADAPVARPAPDAATVGAPAAPTPRMAARRAPEHLAAAEGSLPRVLGPLVDRSRTVGAGTRFLSDSHEVLAKPGGRDRSAPADPVIAPPVARRTAVLRPRRAGKATAAAALALDDDASRGEVRAARR